MPYPIKILRPKFKIFYSSKYIMFGCGFFFKCFGFQIKKNGVSLDINLDLYLFYIHLCIWDKRTYKIPRK